MPACAEGRQGKTEGCEHLVPRHKLREAITSFAPSAPG